MLISPYMLFYGRYARNEGLIELLGLVTIWAILRYLQTGLPRYMYWLTRPVCLHLHRRRRLLFIQHRRCCSWASIHLPGFQAHWRYREYRARFLLAWIAALVVWVARRSGVVRRSVAGCAGDDTDASSYPATRQARRHQPVLRRLLLRCLRCSLWQLALAYISWCAAIPWKDYALSGLWALLIVLFTLMMPQLAPFPVRFVGWKIPTNVSEVMALTIRIFGILRCLLCHWQFFL